MGALLDCFKPKEDPLKPEPVTRYSSTERTHLLSDIPRGPPVSARVRPSQSDINIPTDGVSEPNLEPIEIQLLSIGDVDKQFKDHAGLYNDYLTRYDELQSCSKQLGAHKQDGYKGIRRTMEQIRKGISSEGWEHIKLIRRYKYCMEIKYEGHYFSENETLIFRTFNRTNHLVKELLDKKKPLLDSVTLVIESEERIKRDVFVHCTDSKLQGKGPDYWKICLENLKALRRVSPGVEFIARDTSILFDEMVVGTGILFKEVVV